MIFVVYGVRVDHDTLRSIPSMVNVKDVLDGPDHHKFGVFNDPDGQDDMYVIGVITNDNEIQFTLQQVDDSVVFYRSIPELKSHSKARLWIIDDDIY